MEEDIKKEIRKIIKYCRERDCISDQCKFHKNDDICKIHNPSTWDIEEEVEELKREREMYETCYKELRKQWNRVVDELLGKNYYNDGCDHYSCDQFTADDLIYKYKKRWWQFWKKKL